MKNKIVKHQWIEHYVKSFVESTNGNPSHLQYKELATGIINAMNWLDAVGEFSSLEEYQRTIKIKQNEK